MNRRDILRDDEQFITLPRGMDMRLPGQRAPWDDGVDVGHLGAVGVGLPMDRDFGCGRPIDQLYHPVPNIPGVE